MDARVLMRALLRRCAILASLIVPATIEGQLPVLDPGLRIRVRSATARDPVVGMLLSLTPDTLRVTQGGGIMAIPTARVARIDVHREDDRVGAALLGAVYGTVAGFFVMAPITAPAGFVAGWALGRERWQRVYPARAATP
jgi:hypothetical protein